jgi:hypothetical protein
LKWIQITAAICVVAITTASCIWTSQRVRVQAVVPVEATVITSPVKAHLEDGTTVVYPDGVRVVGQTLQGAGTHYDLALTQSDEVDEVPLDSVIGMESFQTDTNLIQSVVVSTLATAGAIVGGIALAIVIFGSCPTVYSGGGLVEEAELFSSSIAPLFEARDVDSLKAQPDSEGRITLEVRNEAMETHYINHLQILEVEHEALETVLPDAQGRPLIVGEITAPDSLTDSAGQDILGLLGAADDAAYKTDRDMI